MLPHRPRRAFRCILWVCALSLAFCAAGLAYLRASRRLTQWHDDPDVASVWVLGTTRGPGLTLRRGGFPLDWLNAHGITAFGSAVKVTSRFTGSADGIEIWFAYRSHLRRQKYLECHRVGRTAFTDDLGQSYNGFLDFEGDYVGVYLPAYDHAARRLICALHWMPRSPAAPTPVSQPMRFDIELPHVPRLLPPAAQLSFGPVTQAHAGIHVTVGSAHLSEPTYSGYDIRQRDLTFHLDIQGGALAATNVDPYKAMIAAEPITSETQALALRRPSSPWNRPEAPRTALTVTDPYGCALVPERGEVAPMMSLDDLHCTRTSDGVVWVVPVNGAGFGTDAIRLRFDVRPATGGAPVPFDFALRVRGDAEI